MAKYLSTEASWEAAEAAMLTFGGNGVACEYNVERKWKEQLCDAARQEAMRIRRGALLFL